MRRIMIVALSAALLTTGAWAVHGAAAGSTGTPCSGGAGRKIGTGGAGTAGNGWVAGVVSTSSRAAVSASGSPAMFDGRYFIWKAARTVRVVSSGSWWMARAASA